MAVTPVVARGFVLFSRAGWASDRLWAGLARGLVPSLGGGRGLRIGQAGGDWRRGRFFGVFSYMAGVCSGFVLGRAGRRARGGLGGDGVPCSLLLELSARSQGHHPLFRADMVLKGGLGVRKRRHTVQRRLAI